MSKITFRADDHLVTQLEEFEASKSEVMREALREYLGETEAVDPLPPASAHDDRGSIDDLVAERVDDIIEERLADRLAGTAGTRDVNVTITLDGDGLKTATAAHDRRSSAGEHGGEQPRDATRKTDDRVGDAEEEGRPSDARADAQCHQCGELLSASDVYCPNCGEKSARRVFCECGDELRTDWSFCPGCGRRTPAADVLDRS